MSRKPTYTFYCPVCKKRVRSDSPLEPCCTGPSEARDDHEMTVMFLEKRESDFVNPKVAMAGATGPIILWDHQL